MTRLSKQARRRSVSPKRPKMSGPKTGPKKDQLKLGFKEKFNALAEGPSMQCYISKIKSV